MKGKNWMKIMYVLVAVLILTACSTTGDATVTSEDTSAPDADVKSTSEELEVVEVDFMWMSQNWNPVNWGNDPVTQKLTEKTGVKFICSSPSGDPDQIANVMLVSGDYPSTMSMGAGATFDKYVAAGAFLAIDDLSSEYNFPEIMEQIPEKSLKVYLSEDGKLYGVPSWFSDDGFGTCGDGLAVRNDIYVDNGSPTFTTLDDYYNYLVSIENANLTINGIPVWPMAFYQLSTNLNIVGEVANLFGSNIMGYKYYNTSTNRVELSLRAPEILEALTFLNKCYNEGLLDPECFTFDRTTFDEAFCTGKYATVFGNYWGLWNADAALSATDPDMYYVVVDVPQGTPDVKQYYSFYDTAGNMSFEVTANCKYPEAVTRFIDYFLSDEGNILDFYGIEDNTMYFDEEGMPHLMDGVYEAKLADFDGYGKKTGVRVFDVMMDATWNWERYTESQIRTANRAMCMKYAFDGTYLKALSVDSTTDEGILNSEISATLVPLFTKIIIMNDSSQIESMIQTMLENYEDKGLSKLEDEWTRQYTNMLN